MNDATLVGRELAVARVLSGKTARQVAQETGIHKTAISRIERGKENPSPAQLDALRRATGWNEAISLLVRMVLGAHTNQTALQIPSSTRRPASDAPAAS